MYELPQECHFKILMIQYLLIRWVLIKIFSISNMTYWKVEHFLHRPFELFRETTI
jgi:hypothetical protein